jgi:hypothetical protein
MNNSNKTRQSKLKLKSKFCQKKNIRQCEKCLIPNRQTWLYKQTTWGDIHLCYYCKTEAIDITFGSTDALDRAVHHGHFHTRNLRRY